MTKALSDLLSMSAQISAPHAYEQFGFDPEFPLYRTAKSDQERTKWGTSSGLIHTTPEILLKALINFNSHFNEAAHMKRNIDVKLYKRLSLVNTAGINVTYR